MSGHSHWAGIKHRKGINDAKRAKVFTKFGKIITIAARSGGDPETNFQLRLAIDRARYENMPKDNIERAIKRGTGELKEATEIEEIVYEAYGPGNVAMLIKTVTDNKNRTVSELRTIFNKLGGKFVPSGSVSFLFRQVGSLVTSLRDKKINQEDLILKVIEVGAEDVLIEEGMLIVFTKVENLQKIKELLERDGMIIENADIRYIPAQKISLLEENAAVYEKLREAVEEHDDVEEIYDNL